MGLFGKHPALGATVRCSLCGHKFTELKTGYMPPELMDKYRAASVVRCMDCGKVYCDICQTQLMMRGCCGKRQIRLMPMNCVEKR